MNAQSTTTTGAADRRPPALVPFPVGTEVGAERWPQFGRPWKGTVLALDNPEAWRDTLAFWGTPTPEAVRGHCVFRSTRPPIPAAPGHSFQSTRARSERSDGSPLPPGSTVRLSSRGTPG